MDKFFIDYSNPGWQIFSFLSAGLAIISFLIGIFTAYTKKRFVFFVYGLAALVFFSLLFYFAFSHLEFGFFRFFR